MQTNFEQKAFISLAGLETAKNLPSVRAEVSPRMEETVGIG
jgi:hypothetical protein